MNTLKFPDRNQLCNFEDEMNDKGLLHNYTSHYYEFTFYKVGGLTQEMIRISEKFGGKIIK